MNVPLTVLLCCYKGRLYLRTLTFVALIEMRVFVPEERRLEEFTTWLGSSLCSWMFSIYPACLFLLFIYSCSSMFNIIFNPASAPADCWIVCKTKIYIPYDSIWLPNYNQLLYLLQTLVWSKFVGCVLTFTLYFVGTGFKLGPLKQIPLACQFRLFWTACHPQSQFIILSTSDLRYISQILGGLTCHTSWSMVTDFDSSINRTRHTKTPSTSNHYNTILMQRQKKVEVCSWWWSI